MSTTTPTLSPSTPAVPGAARIRLGIVFGGRSEEHPISVKSAREVARHVDLDRYEPHWFGITTDGNWLLCDGPGPGWETSGAAAVLSPDPSVGGVLVRDGGGTRTVTLDVVLPVLHGRGGEDGAIQGLLELAGLPYVGCGIAASALAMDKSLAYLVAASEGVATPAFRTLAAGVPASALDLEALSFPVFVKPARSGSSFGVSKVETPADLEAAVAEARRYDPKVLVEEAVVGAEVGCAVLGADDDVVTGEVDRIALSHGFFRIHQEETPEQGSDNSVAVVPADISPDAAALVRATATTVYRALGCRGLARVDLFLKADGSVVLNEVNTFPGLTSYSRYPRMMAAAGRPMSAVLDRLVDLALADAAVAAVGTAADVLSGTAAAS